MYYKTIILNKTIAIFEIHYVQLFLFSKLIKDSAMSSGILLFPGKIQSETDNYALGKSLCWVRVSPAGGVIMINDLQFLIIQIGKCAGAF